MNDETRKWLEFIQSSGIQLRKIDNNNVPCAIGSGCLIDMKDRRFILTVFHVTRNSDKWLAQIRFDETVEQLEVYYLKQFHYLADIDNGNKIKEVEFAFVEVRPDLQCYFQNRNYLGECSVNKPRTIFKDTDVVDPTEDELYGFAGDVMPDLLDGGNTLVTDHQTYPGLRYIRTENDFHCFKLPVEHPGHEYFKGCSGAPIVNRKGQIVSLVSSGSIEDNEIYGVKLTKCIRTIYPAIGVLV